MAKAKEEYFIQVGKRRNGRIVKAENYPVEDFLYRTVANCNYDFEVAKKPSWYQKLFNLSQNKDYKRSKAFSHYLWLLNDAQEQGIFNLILKDSYGKKRK